MNKNLIIFIILLIDFTICDAHNITVNQLHFQYNPQEDGYFVGANSSDVLEGTLTIPSEYGGKPVVGIGFYEDNVAFTFKSQGNISNVTIPESIKYIGENAFDGCIGLTSLTIPNQVQLIGNSAFNDCTNLKSMVIEGSNVYIDDYSFWDCESLEEISVLGSVSQVGIGAFHNCKRLQRVNIEDLESWCRIKFEVAESNPLMFAKHLILNGKEIKYLSIPDNITAIGAFVFIGCDELTDINFHNGITHIGKYAFNSCDNIRSLNLPPKLVSIEEGTFQGCSRLTDIYIPKSVKYIDDSAFEGCMSIVGIDIPSSVTRIGQNAFSSCGSLRSITIPSSISSIESSTFYACANLEDVQIPNSIKEIGDYAFSNCYDLVRIDIPNSVTSIGKYVFKDCKKLTKIVLPNNLDIINDGAFQLCYALSEVIIPTTVTHIGCKAFWACGQLGSIDIPDSVESIGDGAFQETSLLDLTIPNSVNTIGKEAFSGCRNLKSITLGNGLEHIENYAFEYCFDLEKITVLFQTPIQISSSVFSTYNKSTLYVAKGSKQLFEKEEPWCFFRNIEEYERTIAVTLISLNPSYVEENAGEQIQINATILPEDASNKTLAWSSSDEQVAIVDENGIVSLIKEGTATITASATDGSGVSARCTVVVTGHSGIDAILADKNTYVKIFSLSGVLVYEGQYAEAKLVPDYYIVVCDDKSMKVKVE